MTNNKINKRKGSIKNKFSLEFLVTFFLSGAGIGMRGIPEARPKWVTDSRSEYSLEF